MSSTFWLSCIVLDLVDWGCADLALLHQPDLGLTQSHQIEERVQHMC